MKKIGRLAGVVGAIAVLLGLFILPAAAQDVTVEGSISETTIYTGERVSFSVKISGDFNNISRPKLPSFTGLRLLSNNPSTSRSYSYVNGQSTTSYTYSYYLIAQQEGSYKVPSAGITIDGAQYQTDPIQIRIVDRNSSSQSGKPDIFLQLQVSDEQPVTGQQVVTDLVLFFKDGLEVSSYQPIPGWKAEGFWKEELENPNRPNATSTIINGVRYRRARLLQFSLFPTKSGKLEISPYEIVVNVRSTQSRNDSYSSFFGGFGRSQRQIELSSDPVVLNVRSLPARDEASFMGAVGTFDITRSISQKTIQAGESVELTTEVEGRGNIPLISKPEYDLPEGIEIYEPQESSNLSRRNGAISGTKSFTDIAIARTPGSYTIPAKKISYYDPSKSRYVSQTLSPITFKVTPGRNTEVGGSDTPTFNVSPVTGLANWVTPGQPALTDYWWVWTGLLLPLLILAGGYWRKKYLQKMESDQGFARFKKASGRADQRLEDALRYSEEGEVKTAYHMLQKAITGFISDRLNLPEAGLSIEEYIQILKEQQIDEELIKNVQMLLDKCASISYAPTVSHSYLKSHVGLAKSTIDKLKKVL